MRGTTVFATTFFGTLAVGSLLLAVSIWNSRRYFALTVRQFSHVPISDGLRRGLVRGAIPWAIGIASLAVDVPILSEYAANHSRLLLFVAILLLAVFIGGLGLQVAVAGFNRPKKLVPPYLRDDPGVWSAGPTRTSDLDLGSDLSDDDKMLLEAINPSGASTFLLSRKDAAESTLHLSVEPGEVASVVRSALEEIAKSDITEYRNDDSLVLRAAVYADPRTRNVAVARVTIRDGMKSVALSMYGRDGLVRLRPARKALARLAALLPTLETGSQDSEP
jgi:hypothetical protein